MAEASIGSQQCQTSIQKPLLRVGDHSYCFQRHGPALVRCSGYSEFAVLSGDCHSSVRGTAGSRHALWYQRLGQIFLSCPIQCLTTRFWEGPCSRTSSTPPASGDECCHVSGHVADHTADTHHVGEVRVHQCGCQAAFRVDAPHAADFAACEAARFADFGAAGSADCSPDRRNRLFVCCHAAS